VPDSHALFQLVANVALGGFEAGDGVDLGLGDIWYGVVDGDVNSGGFATGIQYHLGDVTERDARVRKLAFDHGADLFAQRLSDAILMMLSCSVFRHRRLPLESSEVNHSG
jgi:hypothetical protein